MCGLWGTPSVTERFKQVAFGDPLRTLQVGDRAGNFLDLFDAAERELETAYCLIEYAPGLILQYTEPFYLAVAELTVHTALASFHLPFMGIEYLSMQLFRGVGCFVAGADVLHLHIEIYPVQKGIGEAVSVALDLPFGAAAVLGGAQEVAAGAGVHRGDEEKGGRVLDL